MKKRLMLLLLPAVTGLGLWVGFAVSSLYFLMFPFMILLPLTLGFAVQGIALFFSRQRLKWLRFVSLGLLLIPLAGAACEVSRHYMFWQLAVAIWLGAAVFYLTGWGAAWGLEAPHA